jgi:hypothetical protein
MTPFFKERKSALEKVENKESIKSRPISTPFDANAEPDDWFDDPRSTHEINI